MRSQSTVSRTPTFVLAVSDAGPRCIRDGMVARRLEVDPRDVVFVKGVLEASEGLGTLFADRGGSLVVAAPAAREPAFLELLEDLALHEGVRVLELTEESLASVSEET
jgi:hypothetical protein